MATRKRVHAEQTLDPSQNVLWPLALELDAETPFHHERALIGADDCAVLRDQDFVRRVSYVPGESGADVDTCWLDDLDQWGWAYEIVAGAIQRYAKATGIHVIGITEPVRVLRYGVSQFIDWHADYIRWDASKITFVCDLTEDPYQGEGLRLMNHQTPPQSIGDAMVFPSFLAHRFGPVTAGERYALTGWAAGPRYL